MEPECEQLIIDVDDDNEDNIVETKSATPKSTKKKRKGLSFEDRVLEHLSNKFNREENDDRLFFESLLPLMKKVPVRSKMLVRMNIMSVINDAINGTNQPHPHNYHPPSHYPQSYYQSNPSSNYTQSHHQTNPTHYPPNPSFIHTHTPSPYQTLLPFGSFSQSSLFSSPSACGQSSSRSLSPISYGQSTPSSPSIHSVAPPHDDHAI